MKKAIAWEVDTNGKPKRLDLAHIDLEKRLEDWVEADISIVADDALLLGRQISTTFGTQLDVLAIDARGDLVIVELKRDQSLRDTVAQALEYAAWASRLGYDEVIQFGAKQYGDDDGFKTAFEARFKSPLPDVLNDGQRILLVAPEISDATAGVVEYLSATYRVPINAVSFDLFSATDCNVLVRHYVIEESQPPQAPGAKRRPNRSREEFIALAHQNGVGEAFEHLLTMDDILPGVEPFVTTYALRAKTPDKKWLAAFSLYPTAETNPGLLGINLSPESVARLYGLPLERCIKFGNQMLTMGKPMSTWKNWMMVGITTLDQAQEFDQQFRAFVASATHGPATEPATS